LCFSPTSRLAYDDCTPFSISGAVFDFFAS
jgi:hypothetical protein